MENYFGIGLCLVGLAFLLFAVKIFIETIIFLRTTQKTIGKVVSYDMLPNNGGGKPIVEFKTAGERIVRFTAAASSDPPAYKIGDQVRVRFPTKNPQAARINSFIEMWLVTVILAVFGMIWLVIAFSKFLPDN